MKTALVTGASSGIGFEICKMLLQMEYKVYGIGRDFTKVKYENENFIKICCDLTKLNELVKCIELIKKKDSVNLVINNAGVGFFGLHEELNPQKIHAMVSVNLEAPLIISNMFLRDLKKNKGTIVNISSVAAKKISTHGCVYGATKAGLTHFSESLFEEVRKTGVKVITIHPDMAKTNFYRYADFKEGDEEDTYLTAETVALALRNILNIENAVITDLTLVPQKHKILRKIIKGDAV